LRWCALVIFISASIYFLWRSGRARSRAKSMLHMEKHLGGGEKREGRGGGSRGRLAALLGTLDRARYMRRLRASVEGSGIKLTWENFRLIWMWSLAVLPALTVLLTGNALLAPPAVACAFLLPRLLLNTFRRKKDTKAREQCDRLAADLALHLRCGIPIEEAVALCADDYEPPVTEQLVKYQGEVALGGGDSALLELVASLDNPDLELIAQAVMTSRETGSDIRVVMEAVGEALRERAAIRRELDSQTVQGRLSGHIVAGLPFIFLGLSALVSRDTLAVLLGTASGIVMLTVATALDLLGFLWIRRMLDIET